MLASVMLEIIYPLIQFNIPQGLYLQYANNDNKVSQTAFTKHALSCTTQKPQWTNFTFTLLSIVIDFFLNNQPDTSIIQIYSVIKLHMFRAYSLPIIRSFPLYIRHW
jgi:hypothetical protein